MKNNIDSKLLNLGVRLWNTNSVTQGKAWTAKEEITPLHRQHRKKMQSEQDIPLQKKSSKLRQHQFWQRRTKFAQLLDW